ncbi:hypothetical protein TNCV_2035841 [Trichonephila clavipes]|nr:hypothetical protein TNCV_2035841 [Trichonephila clavipes]
MLQDYDTSFSRVYFSRPRFFRHSLLPRSDLFPSVVARSSSPSRLLFDLLPDAGKRFEQPMRVIFLTCQEPIRERTPMQPKINHHEPGTFLNDWLHQSEAFNSPA